jgi:Transcriptional regulator, AbiEi antitoxin/AbiEi antitoxin C-terminal domain/Protein of unknown function (DUF559)
MRREPATDRAIAEIADRQGGVIARWQLIELGLGGAAIDHRVRAGRLHPLHRGVYAVGHRVVGVVGRRWAAVLACGDGAVLAGVSAAAAFGIRRSSSRTIHVLVGRSGRKRRDGIRLHWQRTIPSDEVAELDGLPITTPPRTLLDLAAGGLRGRSLEAAVDSAERQRLLDFADLHALLARYPGRPGTPSLKAVLARHWPHATLVVEADWYAWHRSPSALDDDRERDVELALAGYRTLRFTWHQVTERRTYVTAAILRALVAR